MEALQISSPLALDDDGGCRPTLVTHHTRKIVLSSGSSTSDSPDLDLNCLLTPSIVSLSSDDRTIEGLITLKNRLDYRFCRELRSFRDRPVTFRICTRKA
ncbi:hypothetical protein FRC02_011971 [Tulasnella sp. 418]|nr:hypothetical protein FRC02_011971 [Tulasnella sp. 418]